MEQHFSRLLLEYLSYIWYLVFAVISTLCSNAAKEDKKKKQILNFYGLFYKSTTYFTFDNKNVVKRNSLFNISDFLFLGNIQHLHNGKTHLMSVVPVWSLPSFFLQFCLMSWSLYLSIAGCYGWWHHLTSSGLTGWKSLSSIWSSQRWFLVYWEHL